MSVVRVVLVLSTALLLSGCLAATGVGAALLYKDDGGSKRPVAPPVIEPVLEPPLVTLPGKPASIVTGKFFPPEKRVHDVAVLEGERPRIVFFESDGNGDLVSRASLDLHGHASEAKDLARVSVASRPLDALLVAGENSLVIVDWNEQSGYRVTDSLPLELELTGQRRIAVGDFDGDGVPDAAVSGQSSDSIEIFKGGVGDDGGFLLEVGPIMFSESPRALAAANFDADVGSRSDLAIVEQQSLGPALRLLISDPESPSDPFREEDSLLVPDLLTDPGATVLARNEAVFEPEKDLFPDLVACRRTNLFRILVRNSETQEGKLVLRLHTEPTGPTVTSPGGGLLLHLPNDATPSWDIAAIDWASDRVSIQYGGSDNLGGAGDLQLTLPGKGLALASGDIDGDSLDDIIVAIQAAALPDGETPWGLTVLLTNPQVEGVQDAPLRYRQGVVAGENEPPEEDLETIAAGVIVGFGTRQRFIATRRLQSEVAVLFMDERTGSPLEEGREGHFLPDSSGKPIAFSDVRVADLDLDLDQSDEILVTGMRSSVFFVLKNDARSGSRTFRGGAPSGALGDVGLQTPAEHFGHVRVRRSFRWGGQSGILKDVDGDDAPPALRGNMRIRRPTIARLDNNLFPDIVAPVVPIEGELDQDFVVVVLNPGSGSPSRRFFETQKGPRHISVTEIDGDGAPDLLVSNEGDGVIEGVIEVFLGNPDDPGSFESATTVSLGLPIPETPEFTIADVQDPGFSGPRDPTPVVLFASGRKVGLLLNRTVRGGPVDLVPLPGQEQIPIVSGVDTEFLMLEKIYDSKGLDLIAGDEEGRVIRIMKRVGVDQFQPEETLRVRGRPDELALVPIQGGQSIVSTTKGNQLELFVRACEAAGSCTFQRRNDPINDLVETDLRGAPGVLSVAQTGEKFVVASLREDGERITGESVVDTFEVSQLDAKGIRDIGLTAMTLFSLDKGAALDRIVLGEFAGDSNADLLVHDSISGEFAIFPGTSDQAVKPGASPWESTPVMPPWDPVRGPLRGLGCIQVSGGSHAAFLVTERGMLVLDPKSKEPIVQVEVDGDIVTAAAPKTIDATQGHIAAVFNNGKGRELVALGMGTGRISIPNDVPEIPEGSLVGCARLDANANDYVVLVTPHAVWSLRITSQLSSAVVGAPDLPGERQPRDVTFLNANGDPHLDLCIATDEGTIIVLPGNGLGGFATEAMKETFVWPDIEAIAALPRPDRFDDILVSARYPGLFVVRTLDPKKTVR